MIAIVEHNQLNENKLNKLNLIYFNFDDYYNNWKKKQKTRKIGLVTKEIFSLSFDTTLKQLQDCLFVQVKDENELKGKIKTLEYV